MIRRPMATVGRKGETLAAAMRGTRPPVPITVGNFFTTREAAALRPTRAHHEDLREYPQKRGFSSVRALVEIRRESL